MGTNYFFERINLRNYLVCSWRLQFGEMFGGMEKWKQ